MSYNGCLIAGTDGISYAEPGTFPTFGTQLISTSAANDSNYNSPYSANDAVYGSGASVNTGSVEAMNKAHAERLAEEAKKAEAKKQDEKIDWMKKQADARAEAMAIREGRVSYNDNAGRIAQLEKESGLPPGGLANF